MLTGQLKLLLHLCVFKIRLYRRSSAVFSFHHPILVVFFC